MRRRSILACGLLAGLLVVTVYALSAGPDTARREAMPRVAGDPKASAADIASVGGPHAVARVKGRTLVAWGADSGGEDAGPSAAAWRLYGADGSSVLAEGLGPRHRNGDVARVEVWPMEDGFLVAARRYVLVGLDGEVRRVRIAGETDHTRRHAILASYSGGGGDLIHGGRVARYSPPRGERGIVSVLDSRGGLWLQDLPFSRIRYSPDGRVPFRDVPSAPLVDGEGSFLSVVGDQVLMPIVGERGGITQLLAWSVDAPGRAPIELPTDGLADAGAYDVSVQGLPAGRLLLGGFGCPWFVGSRQGGWTPVRLPSEDDAWTLTSAGDRLYAMGYADVGGFVSRDEGATWRRMTATSVD